MRMQQMSDQELIRTYISGNQSAFEVLLKRHKDQIFTKIFLMVKDRDIANDVFQDTCIKVVQTLQRGKYNEEGKFLPWVLRIAHNLVIDHFRRSNKMPAVRSDGENDVFATIGRDELNAEDQMVRDQIMGEVKGLLKHLPPEQKEVVVMRLYYKMSFKEIAEMNNISINTALGRMRYALINLRKVVEKHNIQLTMQ
ncbi:MAG: RNA polymerase sigma factor [Flavobacteriales bacterium]